MKCIWCVVQFQFDNILIYIHLFIYLRRKCIEAYKWRIDGVFFFSLIFCFVAGCSLTIRSDISQISIYIDNRMCNICSIFSRNFQMKLYTFVPNTFSYYTYTAICNLYTWRKDFRYCNIKKMGNVDFEYIWKSLMLIISLSLCVFHYTE